jgi:hypothetical protein
VQSKSNLSEEAIRDQLADNLDLVETGLTLVKKEQLLRNHRGARGFVDIFARDKTGKLVIIEIKRSNATARQALQEIIKYVALLRQNFLVKETEYRLVVISTDWRELHVPFSEFVQSTRYDCIGQEIILGSDGRVIALKPVNPAPLEQPRRIARRHFIWHFQDESTARAAIPKVARHMKTVGLKDFVIAMLGSRATEDEGMHSLYFAQQELTLHKAGDCHV